MEKSTEVMKGMQNLIKVADIRQTMMEMSKEMMKVCTNFLHIVEHHL